MQGRNTSPRKVCHICEKFDPIRLGNSLSTLALASKGTFLVCIA